MRWPATGLSKDAGIFDYDRCNNLIIRTMVYIADGMG